ncbi:hypothetical protein GC207_05150 [bacterium]|nr:hypothetical protein [bacterium]
MNINPLRSKLFAFLVCATILMATTICVRGQGSLISNGSFENFNGDYLDYMQDWVPQPFGEVLYGYPDGTMADGYVCAVLAGPSTLYQDVPTVPGQSYDLSFAMAGNPIIPEIASMNVFWGENMVGKFHWDPTDRDILHLGWVYGTVRLVASESTTRLTFQDPMVAGYLAPRLVMLDAVELTAVPEPDAIQLIVLGGSALLVFGWTRWRQMG